MANYDHPAYTWNAISKLFSVTVCADELEVIGPNTAAWVAEKENMVNGFSTASGGGGGGETSYPIAG